MPLCAACGLIGPCVAIQQRLRAKPLTILTFLLSLCRRSMLSSTGSLVIFFGLVDQLLFLSSPDAYLLLRSATPSRYPQASELEVHGFGLETLSLSIVSS